MKTILLFSLLTIVQLCSGQPFRYINGNDLDRDSIKLLGIKSYKEYVSAIDDPATKMLVKIVEYDTNGNLTRDWRFNPETKNQNQWTYRYSSNNLLLESATFFPDSVTYFQRFINHYDSAGNLTTAITENYTNGELISTSQILKKYDSKNQLIELKGIGSSGKVTAHYGYLYDEFGNRTDELTYDGDGKVLYHRKVNYWSNTEREEAYGFPNDPNPELEILFRETTTYLADGTRKVEDGFGYRIFDANNMLIYWEEKNYRKHWFEYSTYN